MKQQTEAQRTDAAYSVPSACNLPEVWGAAALRGFASRLRAFRRRGAIAWSWLNTEHGGPVGVNHFSLTCCAANAALRLSLFDIVNNVRIDFLCKSKISTCSVPTIPLYIFCDRYNCPSESLSWLLVCCPWPYVSHRKLVYSIYGIYSVFAYKPDHFEIKWKLIGPTLCLLNSNQPNQNSDQCC